MRNALRIFRRDVVRLLKAPAALVVAMALLVLPSAYTWYNVIGFWSPYDNTGNLRVCVVNQDSGGSSDLTGELNVGAQIVDEVSANDQLDWQFVDYDAAMHDLETGRAYAMFVIPEDFTARLLALTQGKFEAPDIIYKVNEKAGPVSPKITDAGATTLDETINSVFVSTVSNVVVNAIDASIDEGKEDARSAKSEAASMVDGILLDIGKAREALSDIEEKLGASSQKIKSAESAIDGAKDALKNSASTIEGISAELETLQSELTQFSQDAWPLVTSAIASASDASAAANKVSSELNAAIEGAHSKVEIALSRSQASIESAQNIADELKETASSLPDGSQEKTAMLAVANGISSACSSASSTIADMEATSDGVANSSDAIAASVATINAATQNFLDASQKATSVFFGETASAINSSVLQLSSILSEVSAASSNQQLLLDQVKGLLDEMDSFVGEAKVASSDTDALLGGLEQEFDNLRVDIASLSGSDALADLVGDAGLDAASIADFMGSPTEVVTEQLYSLNAYGSAMAPLFMNLTFWIGAFMLLVIMKQEVDGEGIKNLTLGQRYMGRFLLFACMAIIQAIVCCLGVLAIGVQAVNPVALIFAASMASLSYLSIIYALSVTLQHVGKGICILLVFAQIPGATGLYPVEMTSSFFQAIFPLLPFTYGIEAMRESICGFYGNVYMMDMLVLLAFLVGSLAFGLAVRPLMSNVNRMVARQVRKGGVFNGESVDVPLRPYRFSQVVKILADKAGYREQLQQRYARFNRWYPRVIRGSIILGVAVPLVLVVVFAFTTTEKVVILTIWLIWMIALFIVLVVMESLRSSLKRQLSMDGMTDDNLLKLSFSKRDSCREDDAHE